jgi:RimJ/RimL family protein N-acetyltransferase
MGTWSELGILPAVASWKAPRPLPARLETPRLVLRYWEAGDAAGMLEALEVDRRSYLPWLPWVAEDNQDVAQCIFQIERMRRERESGDGNFVIAVFDRATGAVVGGTGLHRIVAAAHQGEIGYWVRPDRRGEGLCTEAVRHLISWALRPSEQGGWGLRRIEVLCAGANAASQRVPRKLGLRKEVHRKQDRFVPGIGWDDTLGWGVVKEEWDGEGHSVRG